MSELSVTAERDIDRHVDRLLADLRGVPPPLPLEAVHDLLKVDLRYYTATDASSVSGFIHRLRIAKHQIIQRPTLVLDVIRKLDLRALWLPDQRRILIDSALPPPKQRWAAGHEVLHSILPWHEAFTHGDRDSTLRPDCHEVIEAEANFGTSRLLFMGSLFDQYVRDSAVDFASIKQLSKTFGNSMASTLWRSVITSPQILVGVLSGSPFNESDDAGEVRHLFCSPNFANQFGSPNRDEWRSLLSQTVVRRSGGPCGEKEHALRSLSGDRHRFVVSCFNTHHAIMTIACERGSVGIVG